MTQTIPNVLGVIYEYADANNPNKVTKTIDSKGNQTVFQYDLDGNLEKITYPEVAVYGEPNDQPEANFTYNSYGQLEIAKSADGIWTEYQYYNTSVERPEPRQALEDHCRCQRFGPEPP